MNTDETRMKIDLFNILFITIFEQRNIRVSSVFIRGLISFVVYMRYLHGRLYAPSVAWLPSDTLASSACQACFTR